MLRDTATTSVVETLDFVEQQTPKTQPVSFVKPSWCKPVPNTAIESYKISGDVD